MQDSGIKLFVFIRGYPWFPISYFLFPTFDLAK